MATTRTPEEIEAIHNRLQQKTEERKNNLKETGFAATNEELAAGEQSGIPLGYTPPSEGVQRISQPDTFIKDESDGQGGRVVTTEVKPSDDLKPIMVQKPETGRAVSLVGDESSNSSKAASSYDTTALKDTAIAVRDVATGQEVLLNRSSPPKDNLNVRNIALDGLKNKTGDNSSSQTDAEKVSSRDAQTASATDESKDLADSGENIIGLSARDDKKKDEQTTENVDSFRVTNNDGQSYSSLSKDSPVNQSVQGVTSIPSVVTKYTDRDMPSQSTVNANDSQAFSSNTATIETPRAKDQLPAGDFEMVAGEKVTQGQPLSQEQQAALQIKNEMSGATQNTSYGLTDAEKDMSDEEFDRLYPDLFAMTNEARKRPDYLKGEISGPKADGKFPHEIEQDTSNIQNESIKINESNSDIETQKNNTKTRDVASSNSNNVSIGNIEKQSIDALPATKEYETIAGETVIPGQPLSEEQKATQQIKDEMSGSSINENNSNDSKFNPNNVMPGFDAESFLFGNNSQDGMNNAFTSNDSSSSFDFNSDGSMNYESQLELLSSIQQSTEFRNGVALDQASINSRSYTRKQRIIQMGGGSSSSSQGAPQTFKPTDSWDPTNVPNPNPNLGGLASQLFI